MLDHLEVFWIVLRLLLIKIIESLFLFESLALFLLTEIKMLLLLVFRLHIWILIDVIFHDKSIKLGVIRVTDLLLVILLAKVKVLILYLFWLL